MGVILRNLYVIRTLMRNEKIIFNVVGTQKNHLNEKVLLSTQNIC